MSDPDDDLVAALRLIGDLIKKAAADDLKALLSGEAKLKIVPPGWKVVQATAKTPAPPKAVIPPASTVRAQLVALHGDDSRRAFLAQLGMNPTQARRLATELGVRGAGRSTVDQAIEKILVYFADAVAEPEGAARY